MGRKRKTQDAKAKKAKRVLIELLERKEGKNLAYPYVLLDQILANDHEEIQDASIAIAWKMSDIREDADGRVELIRVKLGNDLDRELAPYDFVLIVNHGWWNKGNPSEIEMRALLDYALCQCSVLNDKGGEPKVDEKGRVCYRVRKPFKIFPENLSRYGLWQQDYKTVAAAIKDGDRPLLPGGDHAPGGADGPAVKEKPAASKNGGAKKKSADSPAASSSEWPDGKIPKRVKLTHDFPGYTDDINGMYEGVEFPVQKIVNNAPCVMTHGKLLWQLDPPDYAVLEWQDQPAIAGNVGSAA